MLNVHIFLNHRIVHHPIVESHYFLSSGSLQGFSDEGPSSSGESIPLRCMFKNRKDIGIHDLQHFIMP
jgi:hypothetical protein